MCVCVHCVKWVVVCGVKQVVVCVCDVNWVVV